MAASTTTNNTGASPKEKFDAAVNVIHSLPKQGSFQPSHSLMLTFYALFKQASVGPCNVSKPAFWDVVGRMKWEAWNKLGNMKQEEAMLAYVEELKKIIETMPHTDNVQGFVEKLGDFYELVDDDGPSSGPLPNMIRSVSPRRQGAAVGPHGDHSSGSSREGSIDEGLNNLDGPERSCNGVINGERSRSESSSESVEMSLSNFEARGSSESSVEGVRGLGNDSSSTNGKLNRFHEGEENNEDNGSEDDEEFCDTSDITHVQETVERVSQVTSVNRAAGDAFVTSRSGGKGAAGRNSKRDVGAGDVRCDEPRYRQAVLDQISDTLVRLQQDVDNVLTRVKKLESMAQANQYDRHTDERAVSKNDFGLVRKRRWSPFPSLSKTSVIFFIAWPFLAHLIIRYLAARNRRYQR